MKKFILLLISAFSMSSVSAQEESPMVVTPQKPFNGDSIQVVYHPANTVLKAKPAISAVVYRYIDYKWQASDEAMNGSGNNWTLKLAVPENCGFMAFKFYADSTVDNNNNEGYFLMMLDKKRQGLNAKGAYAGWGLSRSATYRAGIPNYITKSISDSATYHWLNQEVSFNQESKSQLALIYSQALKKTFTDTYRPRLAKVTAYLLRPEAPEYDMINAMKIFRDLLNDQKGADSIATVIKAKYPNGGLKALDVSRTLYSSKDPKEIFSGVESFLKTYPEKPELQDFYQESRLIYGTLLQNNIIIDFMNNKNYNLLYKNIDKVDFPVLSNLYYRLVDVPFSRKDQTAAELLAPAKAIMQKLDLYKSSVPAGESYLSPSEWRTQRYNQVYQYYYPTHMGLLNAAGEYRKAADMGAEAEALLNFKDARLNNVYAVALEKLGEKQMLKEVLLNGVRKNQGSVEMLAMLKNAYIEERGSDKGYEEYLASFKNKEEGAARLQHLKTEMMKKPMVPFSMKDLNGKTVSLASLKGKTIVLDFWATWCVPCKASFPGMKLAVEKYSNDPSVAFYFVDTEERGSTYMAEVAKYIKDNNYPFQILFDNKVAGGKTNNEVFDRICKQFHISGIPQKIFIDKQGNVRFINVGFKGSATELADEISAMVELTRAAK